MNRIVLRDLAIAVTVDADDTVLRDVSIAIEDGVITEIGAVAETDGDTVVDGRARLALPGLVNLHTHLSMTLLRGIAEGVDLQQFLTRVWAAEGAVMDPATVELGATLGALESLLGGCTTQLDMYFHHEAAHRGAVAAGSRHVGGPTFFDGPGPDGLAWEERMAGLRAWPEVLRAIGGPEVPVAAMPHSTYTCSVEHLTEVASILKEIAPAGVLHTHVSENAAENADTRARFDATPTELLANAGALEGPAHVVFGHGVHLTETDRDLAAAAGVTVAHCPGSNLKLASGALDWKRWRAHGIPLGIGTDGCASSNDLDMWQAMRQAAHLAALTSGDPAIDAEQIVRAATIDGAHALGLDDLIGSLEVGKRADIVLLDLDQPHLTPVHDVPALLVHAAGRGDVTDVLVDGRIVVSEHRSTQVDTRDLLDRSRTRARDAAAAAALAVQEA
ncbi:putative N-ethylammeline chlorohydrolase [Janibacter sp. HTCC2649]|uniref:amidohydrolase family protein n=1 Tax=Janibacter sp. HTCC2649 TaxID=313589 RepID=UPI0000671A6F|nr:amidohydrolase [Janibacter sp. HTCC2649]EAP98063.1 putative N-ethylammeline chlorohydrolase [Janibacter sp. HTCC2649]